MEARGSLNGHQNRRNSWKIRDVLLGVFHGRVRGGFWMDLGRILGGFWRALGGPGGPNGDQNGGNSWTFRHLVPGWLQGRVWGGFGKDLEAFVRIWKDFEWILNGIWEGFRLKFGRISD